MTALALIVASILAALALRTRRPGGVAEVFVVAFLLFSAVVFALMLGLALAGAVSAGTVVASTWVVSLAAVIGCARRAAPEVRWLAMAVLRRARSERPLFHASLALVIGLAGYTLVQAWVFPSDAWDGVWYHDTLTGWVLQTGGLEPMPLPSNLIQQANGFPKLGELTSAWWCVVVGRHGAELSNLAAAPALGAGTYLLARRFGRRDVALGLAAMVLLVPGSILQWRTTYVDVLVAAHAVAAVHFAAPPASRPLAAPLAAFALALAVGTKWNVLPLVPGVVLAYALTRPPRALRPALALILVALAPAGIFAITVVPNARNFGNPVWPAAVSMPRLGVDWPGVRDAASMNFNAGRAETLAAIALPAPPGRDFADIRKGGYGLAFPWLVLPATIASVTALALRARSRPREDPRRTRVRRVRLFTALALVGPAVPMVVASPAVWSARYLLTAVAIVAAVSPAVVSGLGRAGRWAATFVIALGIALSLVRMASFDPPLGGASMGETWRALNLTAEERAVAGTTPFTMEPRVARARERELRPGDVVVFGEDVAFPSLLWRDDFANRVVFVGGPEPLEAQLERLAPRWIVAADEEPLGRHARTHPDRWEPIGLASQGMPTTAYRRVERSP